jgi:hypothetical protein
MSGFALHQEAFKDLDEILGIHDNREGNIAGRFLSLGTCLNALATTTATG